jgi:predicted PurR-regulated permease PerM
VLLITNTLIGATVCVVFSLTGLPDAVGWGVTAAVLHVVPYLGMALLTGLGAGETFLAHGTLGAALGMAAFLSPCPPSSAPWWPPGCKAAPPR